MTAKRFEAYHWHVVHEIDGHDPQAVKQAILEVQSVKDKPSLIICRTVIGFGSPNKAGKEEAHGAALGEKEVALAREKLGWKSPPFEIPKEIYQGWTPDHAAKRPNMRGTQNSPIISNSILSWRRSSAAE